MKKKPMDYPIFITTIILVCFGIVMVFSSSFYMAQHREEIQDSYYFLKTQSQWAVIGLVVMIIMSNFGYWRLKKYGGALLVLGIGLLVGVLFFGVNLNNVRRWYNVFGVSVQPSEIAKFTLIIYLAASISKNKDRIKRPIAGLGYYLLIVGIMAGLIFIQPNLSTAISFVILALIILYIGGAKMLHFGVLAAGGITGVMVLLKKVDPTDYRMRRYLTFLDPWVDPAGDGFQVIQSLYSLGSGGLFGMGLGQSRQKFLFLPYAETDFIFAIIGEELGFIGASLVIVLFLILIWRGIKIAITAPDLFGCLLAAGITASIGLQTVINIAVVTSSMPATGLPLPFISAGGSSLAFFMAGIGVLLNISKYCEKA
ncbi:MAG: putative lipid II flippase FtsW [Clostridiales bacterium]|nr:putative lipid II flippase FtsW [Clostridiales bacterium]